MIAFMGIEYQDEGVLYFVNVGEKSVWSKWLPWSEPVKTHQKTEKTMKSIASRYLIESVKRDIKILGGR